MHESCPMPLMASLLCLAGLLLNVDKLRLPDYVDVSSYV